MKALAAGLKGTMAQNSVAWLLALVVTIGCSKDNSVDQSTNVDGFGSQCSSDDECGVNSRCVLGFCRLGCTTDAECDRGSICVGTSAPYGCTLPEEGACSESEPCPTGLICGLDQQCRLPCVEDVDCPRNEHRCAAGTCIGESEPDSELWFQCEVGAQACSRGGAPRPSENDFNGCDWCGFPSCAYEEPYFAHCGQPDIGCCEHEGNMWMICNTIGPGWQVLRECGSEQACIDAMVSRTQGGDPQSCDVEGAGGSASF